MCRLLCAGHSDSEGYQMFWFSVHQTLTVSVSEPGGQVRLLSSSALAFRESRSIAKAVRSALWLSLEDSTEVAG